MRLALAGQTYTARSVAAAAQSCINLYPERVQDPNETKDKAFLVGAPGRHLFKDLTTISAGATPFRGIWSGGGRVFVAAGTKQFEISSAGTLIGSVNTIADDAAHSPVQMFANGNQLFIVSAGKCYIDNGAGPVEITLNPLTGTVRALNFFVDWVSGDKFDPGMVGRTITIGAITRVVDQVLNPTTLTVTVTVGAVLITDTYSCPVTFGVTTGAFLDGYFMVSRPNSRQFNISALLDGTNNGTYIWNQLDFGVKESSPDYNRSILAHNEQLYLFGTESFEVWQNTGAASFPFQRIDGAGGRYGSVSAWGPIAMGGRVYFLGGDSTGQVCAYVLDGFTPKRISTHAEESEWGRALLGSTAVSYTYLEDGHQFWGVTFGSGALSWFYDPDTGAWHQRARYSGGSYAPYGVQFHTFVTNSSGGPGASNNWGPGGKHLVGGDGTGRLYESNINFYDDAGADIKWERALPHLYNGGKRLFFGRLELEMETGAVPSGPAPIITRDYSDNRGQTFINPVTADSGVHDDFTRRVAWPANGSSRDRVFRISGIGQSKVALVDCNLDVAEGTI